MDKYFLSITSSTKEPTMPQSIDKILDLAV